MSNISYNLFDCVEMKKEHPCDKRSKLFQIVRIGADIRLRCLGCGNYIMMPRETFEQKLRKIVPTPESIFITKVPK